MSRGFLAGLVVVAVGAAVYVACAPSEDDSGHGPPDARVDADAGDTLPADDGGLPEGDGAVPDDAAPGDSAIDYFYDAVCGEEDLPLEYNVEAEILIVLDRSGSMVMTLNPLKAAVNNIVSATEDRIWFGLMPFPSTVDPNPCRLISGECNVPERPQVEPEATAAADISAALGGISWCGSTPTAATLQRVREYFRTTATVHDRYVLLATDGLPNCNGSLDGTSCRCPDTDAGCATNPEACIDDAATNAALDDLLADGIRTYVLGMGRWLGADRDLMDALAVHGGTEHFYAAEDPAAILGAFESIMGTLVVSCTFDLHPGPETDPTQVNLYVGGEVCPRDTGHASGWDYTDEDTVEFYGDWCSRILSGSTTEVGASYGCPTIFL